MEKKEKVVEVKPININYATICIEGDTDIVLNKMNAPTERMLSSEDRKTQALWEGQNQNKWEQIITSIHWRDGIPCEDTNKECTEEMFYQMLKDNAPCISAFGLKKSLGQAIVRNEIDKYSTKFCNAVNIIAPNGLIPIKFARWFLDKKLMQPQKGAPVTANLNHFQGWSAEFQIAYTEHVYTISDIVNIINHAGFGLGIGSARTSDFGRYHITNIK